MPLRRGVRSRFELLRRRALSHRLALEDDDLRSLPLVSREPGSAGTALESCHLLVYVEHVEERGEELLAGARELRLEGIVAKRADSPYPAGRTGSWRKIKVEETDDLIVVGIAAPSEGTFWRPALILAANAGAGPLHRARCPQPDRTRHPAVCHPEASMPVITLPWRRARRGLVRAYAGLRGTVHCIQSEGASPSRLRPVQAGKQGVARVHRARAAQAPGAVELIGAL